MKLMCLCFVFRYSTPGGYSCKAVHPIALGKVMNIAKMMKSEFDLEQYSLSGIGGVETGGDAAEFILLGANTVQVSKNENSYVIYVYLSNISCLLNYNSYCCYGWGNLSNAVSLSEVFRANARLIILSYYYYFYFVEEKEPCKWGEKLK